VVDKFSRRRTRFAEPRYIGERPMGTPSDSEVNLSRRGFLAALAAAGTARVLRAETAPAESFWRTSEPTWALISDTHISASHGRVVRGANMADNLVRVIGSAQAARPDAVVFNGDLAFNSGQVHDYSQFLSLAGPLLAESAPVHVTLGNHDNREHLLSTLDFARQPSAVAGKFVTRLLSNETQFLFLDSLEKSYRLAGLIGHVQRAWLLGELEKPSGLPTVVFVHHNPDNRLIGLTDGLKLRELLVPHRQVKAVIFGHTHEYRIWSEEGLHFI